MNRVVGSPPWSTEEDQQLAAMALAGKTATEIAEQLKRSESAVRARANKRGVLLRLRKAKGK